MMAFCAGLNEPNLQLRGRLKFMYSDALYNTSNCASRVIAGVLSKVELDFQGLSGGNGPTYSGAALKLVKGPTFSAGQLPA